MNGAQESFSLITSFDALTPLCLGPKAKGVEGSRFGDELRESPIGGKGRRDERRGRSEAEIIDESIFSWSEMVREKGLEVMGDWSSDGIV